MNVREPIGNNTDLDARVAEHLHRQARAADIASTPLVRVVARASQRTRRRNVGLGLGAVIVVAAVSVAGALVLTGGNKRGLVGVDSVPGTEPTATSLETTTTTTEEETTANTAITDVSIGPSAGVSSDVTWNEVPIEAEQWLVNGWVRSFAGDGPLVAWNAQQRGPTDFVSDVFISADGVHWQRPAQPPGLSVAAATASDGKIVLIGSTPAGNENDTSELVVRESDDFGSSWTDVSLPTDLRATRTVLGLLRLRADSATVSVVDGAMVASFRIDVDLDSVPLTDQQVINGYQFAPDGLELLAPCDGCVSPGLQLWGQDDRKVESVIGWDELGVEPAVAAAMVHPIVIVHADRGARFEAVSESWAGDGQRSSVRVSEGSGQFFAFVQRVLSDGSGLNQLWQSPDGRVWTEVGSPPLESAGDRFGIVGGKYVECCFGGIWLSSDGHDWKQSDLSGLLTVPDRIGNVLPWVAEITSHGITALGSLSSWPADYDVVKNGVILRIQHRPDHSEEWSVLDQSSGEVLAQSMQTTPFDNGVVRALGDGKIDVLDPDGNVRATFVPQDMVEPSNAANKVLPPIRTMILHSDDGVSWSSAPIGDIPGAGYSDVAFIATLKGTPTVGIWVYGDPTGSAELRVLVGSR